MSVVTILTIQPKYGPGRQQYQVHVVILHYSQLLRVGVDSQIPQQGVNELS